MEIARNVSEAKRLLGIDDHDGFGKIVVRCLSARGISVKTATTGSEGVACARVFRPDVVFLD